MEQDFLTQPVILKDSWAQTGTAFHYADYINSQHRERDRTPTPVQNFLYSTNRVGASTPQPPGSNISSTSNSQTVAAVGGSPTPPPRAATASTAAHTNNSNPQRHESVADYSYSPSFYNPHHHHNNNNNNNNQTHNYNHLNQWQNGTRSRMQTPVVCASPKFLERFSILTHSTASNDLNRTLSRKNINTNNTNNYNNNKSPSIPFSSWNNFSWNQKSPTAVTSPLSSAHNRNSDRYPIAFSSFDHNHHHHHHHHHHHPNNEPNHPLTPTSPDSPIKRLFSKSARVREIRKHHPSIYTIATLATFRNYGHGQPDDEFSAQTPRHPYFDDDQDDDDEAPLPQLPEYFDRDVPPLPPFTVAVGSKGAHDSPKGMENVGTNDMMSSSSSNMRDAREVSGRMGVDEVEVVVRYGDVEDEEDDEFDVTVYSDIDSVIESQR
jgi:hypothetical protein